MEWTKLNGGEKKWNGIKKEWNKKKENGVE